MKHVPPPALRGLAIDRNLRSAKTAYRKSLKLERAYAVNLRRIARVIADLVRGFDPRQIWSADALRRTLDEYANILTPWATATAQRMIDQVAAHDRNSWREVSAQIGQGLKFELENAPTGPAMRGLLRDQVQLITSIPREAAQRVHDLAQEALLTSERPAALAKKIMATGEVSKSKATLIARTETARTASVLSQVRAQSIGCTYFVWKTVGDSRVRESHRALNGKVFRYDSPPVCDPPDIRALPGQVFNCRCRASPIIPD